MRKHIKTFESFLFESGGEAAGKMELLKTDVKAAYAFGKKAFKEEDDTDMDKDIPSFTKNYEVAKKIFNIKKGTQRKDMPVINTPDMKAFQHRLEKGVIDINKPFAKETNSKNPFPAGLQMGKAKAWMEAGLHDGSKTDDVIKVNLTHEAAKNLKPIQKQVYYDKSIKASAEFGTKGTSKFLKDASILITSSDNYIIDGHHRFLSAMLINPDLKVQVLKIDMPINKLLPMATTYGDAIGNDRNE